MKPYQVLSNGERFRCDLARALAVSQGVKSGESRARELIWLSTLDSRLSTPCRLRRIHQRRRSQRRQSLLRRDRQGHSPRHICRAGSSPSRATTTSPSGSSPIGCSTWPPASCTRRRLRRPPIELEIHRCGLAAWQLFKRHHYLSGSLPAAARCYLTTWDGIPVNFCATLPVITQEEPSPLHADRDAARLPGHRHRHACGRGGGRAASRRRPSNQRHQQPPGADPPLRPLAAVENRECKKIRRLQPTPEQAFPHIPQRRRPRRRLVRILRQFNRNAQRSASRGAPDNMTPDQMPPALTDEQKGRIYINRSKTWRKPSAFRSPPAKTITRAMSSGTFFKETARDTSCPTCAAPTGSAKR